VKAQVKSGHPTEGAMKLDIDWRRPLTLSDGSDEGLIFSFDNSRVEPTAGIYVFGRIHGKTFEALYVGKADDLQKRTKQQLKNLKLMLHLQNARAGSIVVMTGTFRQHQGQQTDRYLPVLERAIIRHFLSEGHDLVNVQGTRIRRHEITSSGFRHMPGTMYVDRGKGE
jgi:hypothetical protein